MDAFTLIFFLLKNKHVVVEKLLEFFIGYVDAKLLKRVEGEDLESSDVKDTNEEGSSILSHKRLVCFVDKPQEHSLVQTLGQCTNRVMDLFQRIVVQFLK